MSICELRYALRRDATTVASPVLFCEFSCHQHDFRAGAISVSIHIDFFFILNFFSFSNDAQRMIAVRAVHCHRETIGTGNDAFAWRIAVFSKQLDIVLVESQCIFVEIERHCDNIATHSL